MKEFLNNLDTCNIVPAKTTSIEHRLEDCLPYYGAVWDTEANGWSLAGAYLPLFTAPMACLVDDKNYLEFDKNGIIPIIPRTVSLERRLELLKEMVWVAFGLDEFEKIVEDVDSFDQETYICVDLANGHMKKLLDLCRKAKRKFNNLTLMTGNIANPNTYDEYAKVGIDYVRVCIGTGSACATNDLTGIGYKATYFLNEIKYRKSVVAREYEGLSPRYKSVPYIVYDGGCSSIRNVIVALALGADYVMCGKIFVQAKEACGEIIEKGISHINEIFTPAHDNVPARIVETRDIIYVPGRMYYGMSTERAQREMGHTKIKHSEGKEQWVQILYTLKEWTSQFIAAISSTMSYCNARKLDEFVGKVEVRFES